jgi:hypothetical protein
MGQKLYELVEELTKGGLSGRTLRRQFHDNPESLTQDLTPEARKALYMMEHDASGEMCKQVKQELEAEGLGDQYAAWEDWFRTWKFPQDEFVPTGKLPKECQHEGGAYPDPKPLVYDIDPRSGPKGGGKIEVVISGQGFVSGRTRLELENVADATDKLTVTPKYSGVEGSYRCGHIYADVTLPAAAGTYKIQVIITTGINEDKNPVELELTVREDAGQKIVFTVT